MAAVIESESNIDSVSDYRLLGHEFQTKYPIPRYIPPPKYYSEKGEDHMYPFNKMGFNLNQVETKNTEILNNLSLFAPYSHEDETWNAVIDSVQDVQASNVHLERPVTPINDEIKAPPISCQKLTKFVRRRIVPRPDVLLLGLEDQKELAAIIIGEVNGVWPDIKMLADDPFLSSEENRELQRRLAVHIVTVCEQLFIHYLQKAQILNKRGVFSGPANMSRLKAQLGLDTNKFLNILTLRRYIVADIKKERNSQISDEDEDYERKAKPPEKRYPLLSYQGLIGAGRPVSRSKQGRFSTPAQDLLEIEGNMPYLDTSKLEAMLQEFPLEARISSKMCSQFDQTKGDKSKCSVLPRKSSHDLFREKVLLKKSDSVPDLAHYETLFEELGIGQRPPSSMSLADIQNDSSPCHMSNKTEQGGETCTRKPEPGSWEYRQDDLHRLAGRGIDDGKGADTEEDLPPLLQALTSNPQQELRRQEIEQRLKILDKQEQERMERERIEIRKPTHPQPATVTTKFPNQIVIRTSDARLSNRDCMSSMTLNKHQTIYNDLVDEIDPATVKKLDSNLFLGNEITEVYKEIMKTVPTDHLELDNDLNIQRSADSLNLSLALASSTLNKKKKERIINAELHRNIEPPWGQLDFADWAKTNSPFENPKDQNGKTINPVVPQGHGLSMNGVQVDHNNQSDSSAKKMPEVVPKSYASWLAWWKNTINSDDYMKYLSTQESDYMGVIFHFYNSDDEDDEDTPAARARAAKKIAKEQQAEKLQKLEELRSLKSGYSEGYWNVNSVLLGGLGKEPPLDDDELTLTAVKSSSSELPSDSQAPPTNLITRKAQKSVISESISQTRDGTGSRISRALSNTDGNQSGRKLTIESDVQLKTESERSCQERLEAVWLSLRMPDNLKLDMAIKYSSDIYYSKLEDAVEMWEDATNLVLKREAVIKKLENFERLASDPNRFFEKGPRGSSVARLEEARTRSLYYAKLETFEDSLRVILDILQKEFQDTLTYEGRPYNDKMNWDKTEMLYWLQEERKEQALEYESRMRKLRSNPINTNLVHLDPIVRKLSTTVN